jgi:hypothetical protein
LSDDTSHPIRIWCTDQGTESPESAPFFAKLLPPYVLDRENPELLFYGPFGNEYRKFTCPRVFITGENARPDFNHADYAIGFDHLEFGDRHLRVPLWVHYTGAREILAQPRSYDTADLVGREFCLSVVSNGRWVDPARDQFFHALNARRKVASMGRHLRNDDRLAQAEAAGVAEPKLSFANKFLFSLAFENSASPGYVTEKIFDAFALGTIPIYWGDVLVARDFNPEAFVNRMEFADDDSCIDYILALAEDPERLLAMLNAPIYATPNLPEIYEQKMQAFLAEICARRPEARVRRAHYGWLKVLLHREAKRYRGFRGFLLSKLERKR